jgi:hypothetical protein
MNFWKRGKVQIMSRIWTKFRAAKKRQKINDKKNKKAYLYRHRKKHKRIAPPFYVPPAECQLRENDKKITGPSAMTEGR